MPIPRAALPLLAAVFLLAALPDPVLAQAPAANANGNDMTRFAVDYTESVAVGIVGGGALLHLLVGGPAATLVGALAGSTLGQHTEQVLREFGYTGDEVADLAARGVIVLS